MSNLEFPAPGIVIVDNFLDNCEEIIAASLKRGSLQGNQDATVILESGEQTVEKETRNTTAIDISASFHHDVMWWILAQKIWKFGDEYAKNYNVNFSSMEYLQFLHYSKNQGFYNIHADSSPSMPRIFSAVLYLNDVEVGGETYFNHFDISVKPVKGRLTMFPANYMYSHGAHVPESNDKFVIVTWFTP